MYIIKSEPELITTKFSEAINIRVGRVNLIKKNKTGCVDIYLEKEIRILTEKNKKLIPYASSRIGLLGIKDFEKSSKSLMVGEGDALACKDICVKFESGRDIGVPYELFNVYILVHTSNINECEIHINSKL
uniref:Uncharacterized protein n=1 Tax=Dikerogammarus haemobaphes virus 1 TaxID=2704946 RepID=A0A6G9HDG4_9VIRU|nr:hypothetical protein [Dikerogammarus haemobaphes virus 1]